MQRLIAATVLLALSPILAPSLAAQMGLAAETGMVDHLTMNQWVRSSEDGSLRGRVSVPAASDQVRALADVSVAIMGRNGEVLRAKSNEYGEFLIAGVEPGVYALTARGDNVFACCAMHVIASGQHASQYPDMAEILVANVDYTVVNTSVIRYMPPNATTEASMADVELGPLADRVCGRNLFRVALSDGGMKGQIHVAGAMGSDLIGANLVNVFIFHDGMEINRTLTDEHGRFAFDNLPARHYSLLAVGGTGIGLISFELVDQGQWTTAQSPIGDSQQLVGLRGHSDCCQQFAMQIAPTPEIVKCCEQAVVEQHGVEDCVCQPGCQGCECCQREMVDELVIDEFRAPVAGCGVVSCRGVGRSVHGGGGGGGLGGLSALAGIGAVVAATNDDNNGPPVIASPAVPIGN